MEHQTALEDELKRCKNWTMSNRNGSIKTCYSSSGHRLGHGETERGTTKHTSRKVKEPAITKRLRVIHILHESEFRAQCAAELMLRMRIVVFETNIDLRF